MVRNFRKKKQKWKNSLDVKFISLGRLVSAFRTPTAHAREISITKNKKKRENLFPRNLPPPQCFVNVQFLGGYRWRSPSDRLVRYNNETLVLLPASTKVSREKKLMYNIKRGVVFLPAAVPFLIGKRFDWPH